MLLEGLIALFLLFVSGVLYTRGWRRSGEPPLSRCYIPYFGNGFEYDEILVNFIQECMKCYGNVFTVTLSSPSRCTFITDPRSISAFLEHPTLMAYSQCQRRFLGRMFGISSAMLKSLDFDRVQRIIAAHLQPADQLAPILQVAEARIVETVSAGFDSEDCDVNLGAFTQRVLSDALITALFGADAVSVDVLVDLVTFDAKLIPAVYGVNRLGFGFNSKRMNACNRLCEMTKQNQVGQAEAVERITEYLLKQGVSHNDIARMRLYFLWKYVSNIVPAAAWALYHILRDDATNAAVCSELETVHVDCDQPISLTQLQSLHVLHSVILETLRMCYGGVLESQVPAGGATLRLHNGVDVKVRGGDSVAVYVYHAQHDPDVFTDALTFKFDRFMHGKTFAKDGEAIKYPFLAFGGAAHAQPESELFLGIIKLFLVHVLARVNLRLENKEQAAKLDISRQGIGVLPFSRDVACKAKLLQGASE